MCFKYTLHSGSLHVCFCFKSSASCPHTPSVNRSITHSSCNAGLALHRALILPRWMSLGHDGIRLPSSHLPLIVTVTVSALCCILNACKSHEESFVNVKTAAIANYSLTFVFTFALIPKVERQNVILIQGHVICYSSVCSLARTIRNHLMELNLNFKGRIYPCDFDLAGWSDWSYVISTKYTHAFLVVCFDLSSFFRTKALCSCVLTRGHKTVSQTLSPASLSARLSPRQRVGI